MDQNKLKITKLSNSFIILHFSLKKVSSPNIISYKVSSPNIISYKVSNIITAFLRHPPRHTYGGYPSWLSADKITRGGVVF